MGKWLFPVPAGMKRPISKEMTRCMFALNTGNRCSVYGKGAIVKKSEAERRISTSQYK
jgi:hypothetical protein